MADRYELLSALAAKAVGDIVTAVVDIPPAQFGDRDALIAWLDNEQPARSMVERWLEVCDMIGCLQLVKPTVDVLERTSTIINTVVILSHEDGFVDRVALQAYLEVSEDARLVLEAINKLDGQAILYLKQDLV